MQKIPLTREYVTIVDDTDYPLLSAHKWYALGVGAYLYAAYYDGTKHVLMHRLLLGIVDAGPQVLCDHINRDTLDNRRSNLRIVTQSQNQQNRRGAAASSSTGVRGVSYDKARRKYRAYLTYHGGHVNLGRFETIEEAAIVAAEGRRLYFTHADEGSTNNAVSAPRG